MASSQVVSESNTERDTLLRSLSDIDPKKFAVDLLSKLRDLRQIRLEVESDHALLFQSLSPAGLSLKVKEILLRNSPLPAVHGTSPGTCIPLLKKLADTCNMPSDTFILNMMQGVPIEGPIQEFGIWPANPKMHENADPKSFEDDRVAPYSFQSQDELKAVYKQAIQLSAEGILQKIDQQIQRSTIVFALSQQFCFETGRYRKVRMIANEVPRNVTASQPEKFSLVTHPQIVAALKSVMDPSEFLFLNKQNKKIVSDDFTVPSVPLIVTATPKCEKKGSIHWARKN